jgi:hypothetical protein
MFLHSRRALLKGGTFRTNPGTRMSLSSLLPPPRHYVDAGASSISGPVAAAPSPSSSALVLASSGGSAGAASSLHIQPARTSASTAVVPLTADANGQLQFDAIVKRGHASHVVVHSGYQAMQAKNESKLDLAKPSTEEEARLAEETKKALGMIVEKKIATAMPTHVAKHSKEAVFIKYTPSEQNAAFNSGASQRIIRLQEMPVDPLQPPKFKVSKLPPAAPDAPVPVMHSPQRKITVEDQAAWQIPPCIRSVASAQNSHSCCIGSRVGDGGMTNQSAALHYSSSRLRRNAPSTTVS